MARPNSDLLRGTLDMLVLQVLSEAPNHGYAIGQQIQHLTDDRLRIEQGSLYPALYRLERHQLVKSKWKKNSTSNRRAKVYQLTRKGRDRLKANIASWRRFVDSVSHVVPGS